MGEGENWLYLMVATIAGWVARLHYVMSHHPEKYVPRDQIDARFSQERLERKDDMREIKLQLQRILDKLESKVDK